MWRAEVPQQPPIRLTPSSRMKRSSQEARSAGVQRIVGVAVDKFRQAGIGLDRNQAGPVLRQPADVFGHFLRAGSAVQAHQRHIQRIDDGGGGGDVWPHQQRAGGLDGNLHEDRGVCAGVGARDLGAVDGGLDLQRVLAGFDQDGIDTAGDQAAALFSQRGFQRVVGDVAQAGQLCARPNAADDPAVAAVGEGVRGFPRQFAGDLVDLEGAVGEIEFAQGDRGAAEGIGFHHVGAGSEVAAMDLTHHVGAGQDQHVGAVLAAPVVLFDVQRQRLDVAAHAAVAQQNAIAQGIKQMGSGHSGQLSVGEFVRADGGCVRHSGGGPDADRQGTWDRDRVMPLHIGHGEHPVNGVIGKSWPTMGQLSRSGRSDRVRRGRSPAGGRQGSGRGMASETAPAGSSAWCSTICSTTVSKERSASGRRYMSARRTAQWAKSGPDRRARARASIALEASIPSAWRTRGGKQFEHAAGSGADVEQPAVLGRAGSGTARRPPPTGRGGRARAFRPSPRLSGGSFPMRCGRVRLARGRPAGGRLPGRGRRRAGGRQVRGAGRRLPRWAGRTRHLRLRARGRAGRSRIEA